MWKMTGWKMRDFCLWHFEGWPCGTVLGRVWGSGVSLGNFVCFQIPVCFRFPIHGFCLLLRQWLFFSRKQRYRMTVHINLTLDGHCHKGQPHLTSHTEHSMSHISRCFTGLRFFLTEPDQTTALEYQQNYCGVKNSCQPSAPVPCSETGRTV